MLFNSFEFLFFLPIVFLLYWKVFTGLRVQNLFVVIASYVFYGWWNYRFLFLIALTTAASFASGLLMQRFDSRPKARTAVNAANIILNLGILCTYKYFNFFAESLCDLLGLFGIVADSVTLDLVLPVGISFYTFQALSYSIDVWRRNIAPTKDAVAFFAYLSFFPQLVAGPIERATNLLPQFERRRVFTHHEGSEGLQQILWGLFKKIVVADNCAPFVNQIFANYSAYSGGMLAWGAILFSFQIYCDFSGYSDIAIGTARLFGIRLMRNFNNPYLSRDIADFWRRWHISLNTWFVDYIYIPLGGSRRGLKITVANVMIIFLLSGLWHGANWTFIGWGLFNALLFLPLLLLKKTHKEKTTQPEGKSKFTDKVRICLRVLLTFVLVTIGWIIFRADSLSQAIGYIVRMLSDFSLILPVSRQQAIAVFFVCVMMAVEIVQRDRDFGLQLSHNGVFRYRAARWGVYLCFVMAIMLFAGSPEQFIYFQF